MTEKEKAALAVDIARSLSRLTGSDGTEAGGQIHDTGWNAGALWGWEFAAQHAANWMAEHGQWGLGIALLRQLNNNPQKPASA